MSEDEKMFGEGHRQDLDNSSLALFLQLDWRAMDPGPDLTELAAEKREAQPSAMARIPAKQFRDPLIQSSKCL